MSTQSLYKDTSLSVKTRETVHINYVDIVYVAVICMD